MYHYTRVATYINFSSRHADAFEELQEFQAAENDWINIEMGALIMTMATYRRLRDDIWNEVHSCRELIYQIDDLTSRQHMEDIIIIY